jgi:hypothetical protein
MCACPCRTPVPQRPASLPRIAAIVAALVLAALFGVAVPAVAEGPPKGIRAPNAWGAILPVGSESYPTLYEIFFDREGRLIVAYSYIDYDRNPPRRQKSWVGRAYDLGARRIVAETAMLLDDEPEGIKHDRRHQWNALIKNMRAEKADEYELYFQPQKLRSEDARLERTKPSLTPNLQFGLRKTDAAGKELFHALIVYTTPTRKDVWVPRYHKAPVAFKVRTRSLFPRVYDLRDGTYLLIGYREPVAIRYYGNLRSPFLDDSDEILMVDAPAMDRVVGEEKEAIKAAGHPKEDYEFWYLFDKRVTARVKAMIAAKRKKN